MSEFGIDLASPGGWLPLVFALVMALSMLAYVILDGYDLGVGALLNGADTIEHKNTMIASIGPFWDANETWLVLGVGVLLVGFPMAHGVILGALYLPVALMLVALSLRGVAFDFRVKAKDYHRPLWDKAFYIGSLLAGWSQGFMLGQLILGFKQDTAACVQRLDWFLLGVCLPLVGGGLADHENRRGFATQGRGLGAEQLVVGCRRGDRYFGSHAVGQSAHL